MTHARYVSGIQPSGELHLGNLFGMLLDQAAYSSPKSYYFVADLHALAGGRTPHELELSTRRAVGTWLAIGVGADGGHIFRQSDIAEVLQLQWLLGTLVDASTLDIDEDLRARRERGTRVTAARANYALLMAADILALRATHVILGADQDQHLRMARQYAVTLNQRCNATSMVPQEIARVPAQPRGLVLGSDGTKMSKDSGNSLSLRASDAEIQTYIRSLHPAGYPKRSDDCLPLNLLRHIDPEEANKLALTYESWRTKPAATQALHDRVINALEQQLGGLRSRHAFYDSDEGGREIEQRLEEGAESARAIASETVREVRAALRSTKPVGKGRPAERGPGPKPLSYSEYINVPALLDSVAPPSEPPRGVDLADWPWAEYAPSTQVHGGDGVAPDPAWKLPPLPKSHPAWAHDEVLFISTHQAFEVWFRHALFEMDDILDRARGILAANLPAERANIPHSVMMRRHPEWVAHLHFDHTLAEYPGIGDVFANIQEDSVEHPTLSEYGEWIRETPRPGAFPEHPELPPLKLSWFADEFSVWAQRLTRIAHILTTATTFFDVLRRMSPKSFLSFRSRLSPASGFGSGQYREIEILSGQRERHFSSFGTIDGKGEVVDSVLWDVLRMHADDDAAELASRATPVLEQELPDDQFQRVRARMLNPTLRDLTHMLLLVGAGAGTEHGAQLADRVASANFKSMYADGKRARLARSGGKAVAERPLQSQREREVWRILGAQLSHMESIAATAVLGDDPSFGAGDLDAPGRHAFKRFLESCLEFDRALMAWRMEHLSFVESMIGARPGTGGGGLVYLQATIEASRADYVLRSFPPVWAARSLLVALDS